MVIRHSIWIGVGMLIFGLAGRMTTSARGGENPPLFSANTAETSSAAVRSGGGASTAAPGGSGSSSLVSGGAAAHSAAASVNSGSLEEARQKEGDILAPRKGKAEGASAGPGGVTRSGMPTAARMILSLLAVLAMILAGTLLLRRFSRMGRRIQARSGFEILSRTPINSRQSLVLVKLGARILVLGVSPNHIASLDTIDEPEELSTLLGLLESQNAGSISRGFETVFHRQSKRFDSPGASEFTNGSEWNEEESRMVRGARHELTALLEKVKGLSRIRFRSGTP